MYMYNDNPNFVILLGSRQAVCLQVCVRPAQSAGLQRQRTKAIGERVRGELRQLLGGRAFALVRRHRDSDIGTKHQPVHRRCGHTADFTAHFQQSKTIVTNI